MQHFTIYKKSNFIFIQRTSSDTEEDREVQDQGLKRARQNRSFAEQVKQRVSSIFFVDTMTILPVMKENT